MSWSEFVDYYDEHVLRSKKPTTESTYDATISVFGELAAPAKLADVTTARVTAFSTALRAKRKVQPATIARHLRTLRAIVRWAHSEGLITNLPKFTMPDGAKKMKGRPITDEEFHILLSAVGEVVGKAAAEPWRFLLRGFWTSGLRLREACNLHWGGHIGHVLDFSRRWPMFRICGDMEKGGRDRLLPMAPEFAELLERVSPEHHYGRVFELVGRGRRPVTDPSRIGQLISAIGKASGVAVSHNPQTGEPKKFASAHDLRRSFGFRWSQRVMPAVLMELMRHSKIETTMKYYVGENADATAEEVWEAFSTNPVPLQKTFVTCPQ